jgi:glycosyltransferase involved in cell wall biosynthesis
MIPNENKVLILISSLGGGGAEAVCINVANGLAETGWQVDLVILNLSNATYLERLSSNVNLKVLGVSQARYATVSLLKELLRLKTSKILVFDFELTIILVLIRLFINQKITIISRNINTLSMVRENSQNYFQKKIINPILDFLFGHVDHVINQCHAMQDDLISICPNLKNKSSVIYNPVAKHIEDYVAKNHLDKISKRDYVLCVGRLEKQKAFHNAIIAFAQISLDFPNLRLKIVGEGSLENDLKLLAVEYGVSDKVDFEGFQIDLIPYYKYARVTILTSLYEGFPNVIVESIALNTPVVAFDCKSGPKEIIQDKINGFLVEYNNIFDLKSKLKNALMSEFSFIKMQESINKNKISEIIKNYSDLLLQMN